MEYDQIMSARISVVEARLASIEERLATLERGGTAAKPRRRKDLSPEDRAAIRARLVAGQERKRREREAAEAKAEKPVSPNDEELVRLFEARKSNKKKEAKNGTSQTENKG